MEKFKKILFPFFNKKHHDFLIKKSWVRLLIRLFIVLYTIGIIVIFISIWIKLPNLWKNWDQDWCLTQYYQESRYTETLINQCTELSEDGFTTDQCKELREEMVNQCGKLETKNFMPVLIIITLISTIIAHYFIQFVLFKLIIDFIILGDKK